MSGSAEPIFRTGPGARGALHRAPPRPRRSALWGHSADELAEGLGRLAQAALLAEARLTPKPGLVDRRGSGAHHDLSLALLERSAAALRPGFTEMAALACDAALSAPALRAGLAAIGRRAEQAMLAATEGANAHRGAIWSLGLACGAAAQAWSQARRDPRVVFVGAWQAPALAARVARIARCADPAAPPCDSHGQRVRLRYGLPGALEEAQAGFPHVMRHGLTALRRARALGLPEPVARLDSLLSLMARLPDTCLLHRGGLAGLQQAQRGAAWVLACGGCGTPRGRLALAALHQGLMARWLSPGSSADLLATTLFFDALGQPGSAAMLLDELSEALAHGNPAF